MSIMAWVMAGLIGLYLFDGTAEAWERPYLMWLIILLIVTGLVLEILDRIKPEDE